MIDWIVSPGCKGSRLTIAVPRAVRSFIGISCAFKRYTRPRLEKNNKYACADVWMMWTM